MCLRRSVRRTLLGGVHDVEELAGASAAQRGLDPGAARAGGAHHPEPEGLPRRVWRRGVKDSAGAPRPCTQNKTATTLEDERRKDGATAMKAQSDMLSCRDSLPPPTPACTCARVCVCEGCTYQTTNNILSAAAPRHPGGEQRKDPPLPLSRDHHREVIVGRKEGAARACGSMDNIKSKIAP